MIIKEITDYLESLAPISSQESYDNSGLIVGDSATEVTNVLISLDCIESTVDEAIELGCELIIAHHPIVFSGLKKLNGKNYIERTVIIAIKNDIAIYAIHTNFDNYRFGVNDEIADRLKLMNRKLLAPKSNVLSKVSFFVPAENKDEVVSAMFSAGAGEVGEYSECSFQTEGIGTFKPSENANPVEGKRGELSTVNELKVEVLCSQHSLGRVLNAMYQTHPYEEVAHDIYAIQNKNQFEGSGMIGDLEVEMDAILFLTELKKTFNCGVIRHTEILDKKIKRVALCGGSGSFLLEKAKSQNADIFITGDFKYHEFFDADKQLVIADIGHFESEQYTSNRLERILIKKFTKFAVHLTKENTNPIKYF